MLIEFILLTSVTACLLHNEPASCCLLQVKPLKGEAKAKASANCATECSK